MTDSQAIRVLLEAITASRETTDRQIAASREVADQQIASLNATVARTSQNIDRAIDRIEQSVTKIEQSSARVEYQVGVMAEHLTAVDIKLERLIDAMNLHLRIADKNADNIAKQNETISELAKLVAAQANTVAVLIARSA